MKNINEWLKLQKLNQVSSDWSKWYGETKDTPMKTYREWKIQKNLEVLLEQEPPIQPGQLPPPDPNQPQGPPPPGGQPPPPPGQPQSPPPQAPEAPPEDDKALISQLQGVLGQKVGSALMPAAVAMKEEAKKVKSLADQKQLNPSDGLKMWLWTCINAWQKTVESQTQAQPKPQPQPQPPTPGPGMQPPTPGPGGPGMQPPMPGPGGPGMQPPMPGPGM